MGLLTLSKKDIEEKVKMISKDPDVYFSLNKRFRRNSDILRALIVRHPQAYESLSEEEKRLVTNSMLVYAFCRLGDASDILKVFEDRNSDREICVEAVKASPRNIRYLNSDSKIYRSLLLDIVDEVRLDISNMKEGWFDRLRKDKSQYVYYIPHEMLDEEIVQAIERSAIHSIELSNILVEVGYGSEFTY